MKITHIYNPERVLKILDEIEGILQSPLRVHEDSYIQNDYEKVWARIGSLGREIFADIQMGNARLKELFDNLFYATISTRLVTCGGEPDMKVSKIYGAPDHAAATLKAYLRPH